jgi:hypothetical protein
MYPFRRPQKALDQRLHLPSELELQPPLLPNARDAWNAPDASDAGLVAGAESNSSHARAVIPTGPRYT